MKKNLLLVLVSSLFALSLGATHYKQLQGPPSQFAEFSFPTPQQSALSSTGAFVAIDASNSNWNGEFVVDSKTSFSFCSLSPFSSKFSISVNLPGASSAVPLSQVVEQFNGKTVQDQFALGTADSFPTTCYSFLNPTPGIWGISLSVQELSTPLNGLAGYFIVNNESPYEIVTYNTDPFVVGDEIKLEAFLQHHPQEEVVNRFNLTAACQAQIILPDGSKNDVGMNDDGIHPDLVAKDGIYTGILSVSEEGSYQIETVMQGKTTEGIQFLRTTQQFMQAVESDIDFTGTATAELADDFFHFKLSVQTTDAVSTTYIAFAEVYGVSEGSDTQVPVAWISGITALESDNTISLSMSSKWVSMASSDFSSFVLKNVRIQHVGIQTVLSTKDEISVQMSSEIPQEIKEREVSEISEEMTDGIRPPQFQKRAAPASGKLLLVHGYCADGNPFSASDFTDYLEFNDPNANRNLDKFAQLILDLAAPLDSFSIVAHSQGGLASLHLLTYYWTGMDTAPEGRVIQSVGSPYQGTALAGSLAGIGSLFGYGCGSNEALTKDGAKKWLTGIPAQKQQKVYYYTTEGTTDCSSAANFVGLDEPNDGVTSRAFSQLPSGNKMGHTVGWCHTTDMSSPSQCKDHARNSLMNSLAAR